MVKQSKPDEIALDDIMKEGMKEMGKSEASQEEVVQESQPESPKPEQPKPQFGFKLSGAQTPDSFVVSTPKQEKHQDAKKQVILDKPSQSLDDDIVVDW